MTLHVVKTLPKYFAHRLSGQKMFEVRLNDRGYKVGDTLLQREYDGANHYYTGRSITSIIIHMTDYGSADSGMVVLGLDDDKRRIGELEQQTRKLQGLLTRFHAYCATTDALDEKALQSLISEYHAAMKGRNAPTTEQASAVAITHGGM